MSGRSAVIGMPWPCCCDLDLADPDCFIPAVLAGYSAINHPPLASLTPASPKVAIR